MEIPPCPISLSTEFSSFLHVSDRFDTTGEKKWNLVRSCKSGLLMLNPRPGQAEIPFYYRNGRYDPHLTGEDTTCSGEQIYLALHRLLLGYRAGIIIQETQKPAHKLSVLEIGCSTGDLLDYLHRKKGIPLQQLAGIEPDTAAAEHARSAFNLEIHGSIHSGMWEARTFDRIVLWHALEHIHTINETLARISEMLAPEGRIVIAVPNADSFDAEHYRENWIAWDAPRHLFHFSPGTLEKLLERHKLRILASRTYFPDTLYNFFFSEKLACSNLKKPFHLFSKAWALFKAGFYGGRSIIHPGRSSSLVYFAVKT
ncbi:MAG: class I SAM-dependent methyltransferase [Chlorobium sp.]|nr:MAG: class I SAM-dependent methyltransferase [Chlorobium sp.]